MKNTSDGLFFAFFARRLQAKRYFWQFLMKKHKRQAVFIVFRSSLASETLFLAIFEEKTRATGYFSHFLHFAHERRMIFSFYLLSSVDDGQFSSFFGFHPRMKDGFCLFSAFIRGWRAVFPEKLIIYSCILYYFPHIRYILSKYMKFNIKVNNYLSFCYCIHYSLK